DRQYDTFNSAAYLAGQMQRFAKYASSAEIAVRLRASADATVASLFRHRLLSPKGTWYWNYSIQEHISNDFAHASYIVTGLQTYVREDGGLSEQIALGLVVGHLADFSSDDRQLRGWPAFE